MTKAQRVKPKKIQPPGHLLLTVAVDRQTGQATVYGNAASDQDHAMLLDVLRQVETGLQEKRLQMAVARAVKP